VGGDTSLYIVGIAFCSS